MRTGVCTPSYAALATYASLSNTNYVPYSQDLSHWVMVNTTYLADTTAAPDGTITADKLREDATNSQHYGYIGSAAVGNIAVCATVYLKAAERSQIQLNLTDNTTGATFAAFDLVAGTNLGSGSTGSWAFAGASIRPVGNGWYQCSVWGVKGAGTTVVPVIFLNTTQVAYAGTAGYGIYVWGMQLTPGLVPRPYLPTTSVFPLTVNPNTPPLATYPLSNLSDLVRIQKSAVWVPATGLEFIFTLPSPVLMDFLAFVHHAGYSTDYWRMVLFSDASANPYVNGTNLVHDSDWQPFWPNGLYYSGGGFVRPYLLPSPVTVQSGYIQITSSAYTTGINPILGAMEMGRLWQWTDTAVDRELGYDARDNVAELPSNVDHRTQVWSPRTWKGNRKMVDQSEIHGPLLDFQAEKGVRQPFVFVEDYDDPTTWERACFLARNNTLPAGVANDYPSASMSLDLIEHLR